MAEIFETGYLYSKIVHIFFSAGGHSRGNQKLNGIVSYVVVVFSLSCSVSQTHVDQLTIKDGGN
ncbi:MAG: hypothetical protein KFF73_04175 [Cyclobacteriaceae bacterium]|nr:hypothetical protein [Cyclobacteriaceae bacterium]